MTDLAAYESALVERVARALHETAPTGDAFDLLAPNPKEAGGLRDDAAHVLRALGLLGPSRTAWLAPWEATEGMNRGGAFVGDYPWDGKKPARVFAAMRDAHLKEGGA